MIPRLSNHFDYLNWSYAIILNEFRLLLVFKSSCITRNYVSDCRWHKRFESSFFSSKLAADIIDPKSMFFALFGDKFRPMVAINWFFVYSMHFVDVVHHK